MLPIVIAQASSGCTLNGQPVDCGTAVKATGGLLAGAGIFLLLMLAFAAANFVFWLLSLIHLIKHDDVKDRVLWILLIFLIPLAAWVYYLGIRKSYEKEHQAVSASPVTSGAIPSNPIQPDQPAAIPQAGPEQTVEPVSPPSDSQPPASPLVQ